MDEQKIDRMLAKAAARGAARGHASDREPTLPKPKRTKTAGGHGRDADALLDRLRKGKGSLTARG